MMRINYDEDRKQSSRPTRRRPGLAQGVTNWWMRRRRFYVVQDNSLEDDDAPIVDMTMEEDSFEVEVQLSSARPDTTRNSSTVDDDDDDDEGFSTMPTPPPPPPTASSGTASYQPTLPIANSVPSSVTPTVHLTPTRTITTASILLTSGRQSRFARSRTKDSFQGSLESIDSLSESCWDPEDDASLATPIVTNVARPIDFYEHVDFLRVQTQPRKVEVVWAKTESPPTTAISPVIPRMASSS
jgi:hypothetical protein